ncbi:MAG: MFS transporter, partial [Alphaproteobacteria bacterium]
MTVPPAPGAKTSQFSGRGLVVALCLAEVLGMTATMTFPALLLGFLAEWRLSNTAAGWING